MEEGINVTVLLFYLCFPNLMIYSPMVDVEIQFEASSECNKISSLFCFQIHSKMCVRFRGATRKGPLQSQKYWALLQHPSCRTTTTTLCTLTVQYSMKLQMDWWICQFSLFLLSLQGDNSLTFNRCQFTLGHTKCFFWHINAV